MGNSFNLLSPEGVSAFRTYLQNMQVQVPVAIEQARAYEIAEQKSEAAYEKWASAENSLRTRIQPKADEVLERLRAEPQFLAELHHKVDLEQKAYAKKGDQSYKLTVLTEPELLALKTYVDDKLEQGTEPDDDFDVLQSAYMLWDEHTEKPFFPELESGGGIDFDILGNSDEEIGPYADQSAAIEVGYDDRATSDYESEQRNVTVDVDEKGAVRFTSWVADREDAIDASAPWGHGVGSGRVDVLDQSNDLDAFLNASVNRVQTERRIDQTTRIILGRNLSRQSSAIDVFSDSAAGPATLRQVNGRLELTKEGGALLGLVPTEAKVSGDKIVVPIYPGSTAPAICDNAYADACIGRRIRECFQQPLMQARVVCLVEGRSDFAAMDPYERRWAEGEPRENTHYTTFKIPIAGFDQKAMEVALRNTPQPTPQAAERRPDITAKLDRDLLAPDNTATSISLNTGPVV